MTEEAEQEFMTKAEPQEEHRWLQRLAGEWTYEGKASMGPGQEPQTMRGAVTARRFGDLWLMIEEQGYPGDKDAHTNIITLGYDPQRQRFTGTFVDSGTTHLWVYDGSLAGNTLTLEAEGPAMGRPGMVTYHDVIEIVDGDHFVLRSRAPAEDGNWYEFMETHYRRK